MSELKELCSSVDSLRDYCCHRLFCYCGTISIRNVLDIKAENPTCAGINKQLIFLTVETGMEVGSSWLWQ